MDGERKKRKIDNVEAEKDNEEEKMEKFYALIRSTQDVRERIVMSNANRLKLEEEKQKKKANYDQNKPPVAVWKPTFQPEDFMEDHPHHHQDSATATTITTTPHPSTSTTHEESGPSNSKKQDEAKDQDDDKGGGDHYHDLDLKLSL